MLTPYVGAGQHEKAAKRFINEMQMLTKLGMGQVRTAKEIIAGESLAGSASVGTLEGDAQAESMAQSLDPVKQIKVTSRENCWTTYLESNPAMKSWAEANPAMAEQNKKKFYDC